MKPQTDQPILKNGARGAGLMMHSQTLLRKGIFATMKTCCSVMGVQEKEGAGGNYIFYT